MNKKNKTVNIYEKKTYITINSKVVYRTIFFGSESSYFSMIVSCKVHAKIQKSIVKIKRFQLSEKK